VSTIIHDLRCKDCSTLHLNVAVESGTLPGCTLCGGEMVVSWEGGKPPGTDVYGNPKWNEGTGRYESSHREAIKYMRSQGWEGEAGDPVGGARKEHKIVGRAISYPGQGSRVSTGERT
jgi:hypothetical protein